MSTESKKILITGSNGFIGSNFSDHLKENTGYEIYGFNRNNDLSELPNLVKKVDLILHLAGVNRPKNIEDFKTNNVGLTTKICSILKNHPNKRLIYFSSIQALKDNNYGRSKKEGEEICLNLARYSGNNVNILRLPGVFGENCKPNYNSVVATFCYNLSNNIELKIIDKEKEISLVYVRDICNQIINLIQNPNNMNFINVDSIFRIKIIQLAKIIKSFKNGNTDSLNEYEKKLFMTYLTYKNTETGKY